MSRSDQTRLVALLTALALLWLLEYLLPLYKFGNNRWRRALPNLALTALLVFTNIPLSFVIAGVSRFSMNQRFGFFFLFNAPVGLVAVLSVIALDLFTYFAHV